ncbi:metallophosphoesterase family protein [Shouchella lonarensis]|uniref:Phosphoesterase n=1 Tax=Shouchella lonarensis TaxID=1464122 RepID=A0A1G6K0Z7_9BACI|nr:metallophosphoesterase [Shouchella lonarensis]SDC24702.1 hypothetical protein SAMN05421737_106159 [Shouchella lonarensis]
MKVLIVSDSHGWQAPLQQVIERHAEEVEQMIHVGDSQLPADAEALLGVHTVAGNCDMPAEFVQERLLTWENVQVWVTHGHLYGVKKSCQTLVAAAKGKGVPVVVYGHTHVAISEMVDGVLCINPGSIRLPRGYEHGTYCIVDVNEGAIAVCYFTIEGRVVEEMSRTFSL